MSAKTCGNCGWLGEAKTHYVPCNAPQPHVIGGEAGNVTTRNCGCDCPAHKPLIPARAQSFVICNGKVRVWAVKENGQSCSNCDFKAICDAIPTAILGCNNKHYRIVAVEMVEGE